jgi:hypothetical protein
MTGTHTGVLGFLDHVSGYGLVASLVLLPIALLIRKLRGIFVFLLYITSYALGADVWLWSAIIVHHYWGTVALVIGLMIFGVGVAPMALLASAFHGNWFLIGGLLLNLFTLFGIRFLAASIAEREEKAHARAAINAQPGLDSLSALES